MNSSQITLKQFFAFQEKNLNQDRLSAIESSDKLSPIKQKALEKAKAIKWHTLFKESVKQTEDLLNINLAQDIMVKAWNKSGQLLKYLDKEKYPPDQTFLVRLVEHTIKSEHQPYLEIFIDDEPIGKIRFNLTLALTFKGLDLKIKNGKIIEILTGACTGKGTIKCENFLIWEKPTEPFPLPGSIPLGEGITVAK